VRDDRFISGRVRRDAGEAMNKKYIVWDESLKGVE
jgi:hypothetical protein